MQRDNTRIRLDLTPAQRAVIQWRFLDNDDDGGIEAGSNWMDLPVERSGYIVETLAFYADLMARNMARDTIGELRATRILLRKVREAVAPPRREPTPPDRCPRCGNDQAGSFSSGQGMTCCGVCGFFDRQEAFEFEG